MAGGRGDVGKFASLDKGARLKRLEGSVGAGRGPIPPGPKGKASSPEDILKQIGALVTARSTNRFKTQRFGNMPWAPRGVPSRLGIIADLKRGSTVKDRRFEPRPAGVDTGRLQGSINWRIVGAKVVEIGTTLPYAPKIQGGDTVTEIITPQVKDGLAALVGKDPRFKKLAGLLKKDRITVTIPPRPFVGMDKQDREDVEKLVGGMLSG